MHSQGFPPPGRWLLCSKVRLVTAGQSVPTAAWKLELIRPQPDLKPNEDVFTGVHNPSLPPSAEPVVRIPYCQAGHREDR